MATKFFGFDRRRLVVQPGGLTSGLALHLVFDGMLRISVASCCRISTSSSSVFDGLKDSSAMENDCRVGLTNYRPGPARRYAPADGSSTRGGFTSVPGPFRSPHISSGRLAAGSQRADSLGSCAMQPACCSLCWDRQTGGSRYRLMPRYGGGIINEC